MGGRPEDTVPSKRIEVLCGGGKLNGSTIPTLPCDPADPHTCIHSPSTTRAMALYPALRFLTSSCNTIRSLCDLSSAAIDHWYMLPNSRSRSIVLQCSSRGISAVFCSWSSSAFRVLNPSCVMRGSPQNEYVFPGVSPHDGDVFCEGGTGCG